MDLPGPVLDQALTLLAGADGDTRDALLAALVAAHPEHAGPLRTLARSLHDTDRLLVQSYGAATAADPERIGPYRVLRRLGEGAFGVVYLCAQDAPIRRQVAVKVLRPGAGDQGTLARFEAERQVLVGFDHPGIAGLIDAGALPDGRPFFTMEHVDGVPIREYCDANHLSVDARLALFVALCGAVTHAHARGVVHRDLKPANVLVVERDGKAVPKVIDFGIAKALHSGPRQLGAQATATGRVLGTPGYMSPEQAAGNPNDVDVRADVFSLGVMLYELLVGTLPWSHRHPVTGSEPQRPSTRVRSDPDTRALASRRSTAPQLLVAKLRNELDWIVLKALHQRRELRYPTVTELADDVQRHLDGEPVRAGPPSTAYRLRRTLRRHRTKAALVLTVVLLGIAVAATGVWFRRDARSAAAARLADADVAVRKLTLRAFDPRLQDVPSSDALRRDLLQDALALADRAMHERSDPPEHRYLRALVLSHLADVYFQLAQYPSSSTLAAEVERETDALCRDDPANTKLVALRAAAQRSLGRAHTLLGHAEEGLTWSTRAAELLERLCRQEPDAHDNLLAKVLVERASAQNHCGDAEGELATQRRAIEVLQRKLGAHPDHVESQRDLVRFQCSLGGMLQRGGSAPEAEAAILQARELAGSPAVTDDERALVSRRLGILYAATARAADAVGELTAAVVLTRRVLERHPGRKMLHSRLRDLRTLLCEQLHLTGDAGAAEREAGLAIRDAEALAPDYPGWQAMLADTLSRVAWSTVTGDLGSPPPGAGGTASAPAPASAPARLQRCLELTEGVAASDAFGSAARQRALVTRRFAAIHEELRRGRLVAAESALRSIQPRLHEPEHAFHAGCVAAEILGASQRVEPPDAATGERAGRDALDAWQRAVANGFRDRRRLLACAERAGLREHPEVLELLARLPD